MALTINEQPSTDFVQPAWNKIQYLVNSTNTAQSGFKVICRVFIDPTGANTLVQVLNLEVVPDTTKTYVSIQNIIQTYINDVYSILSAPTIDLATQDLLDVKVTFIEFYDEAEQGSTLESDTIFLSRSSFSRTEWINGDFANFQFDTDTTFDVFGKWLNGFENEFDVSGASVPPIDSNNKFLKMVSGQKQQLRFMMDNRAFPNPTLEIDVYFFDASFVQTKFNFLIDIGEKGKLFSLDIGTDEIGNHSWVGIPSMVPGPLDKYMAIHAIYNPSLNSTSTTKLFEIVQDVCTGYTPYEVHWVNRYGGFDSYTFTAKSRHNTNVNQETFKNEATEISGDSFVETTSKRFVQPFYTQLKEEYVLNSQNLLQWEYEGLKDLTISPEIYVKIDGDFYSAIIMNNRTVRNFRNEETESFNMQIRISIDTSEQRQW